MWCSSPTTCRSRSHVTFTFRFRTSTVDGTTFLYNMPYVRNGALTKQIAFDGSRYLGWNRPQTYSVSVNRGDGEDDSSSAVLGSNLLTPPDVVGAASTGDAAYYHTLANAAIHNLSGGVTVFAGQRDDPFYANLGPIFDILTLDPLIATGGEDYLNNENVHSIVLSVPKSMIKGAPGDRPQQHAALQGVRGQLGAGFTVGEPADQRGRDRPRPEGPLQRLATRQ